MCAFEEDFVSVDSYVNEAVERCLYDADYCKIISYLSIITYFTETGSLSHKIAKKLLSQPDASLRTIRSEINNGIPSLVYVTNTSYRICHPVIAYRILLRLYGIDENLSNSKFCQICKSLIEDIRRLDGGEKPSDYANELITSIFLVRSFVDHEDENKDILKNTFADILLNIKNGNLQEEIFSCLVMNFPQNPHNYQHFGRLISINSPGDYIKAKEQFDKAILLDKFNPVHYHARGMMYFRYCRYLLNTNKSWSTKEIYDNCKNIVEFAIEDFENAATFAQEYDVYGGGRFNLSYPYGSILNTCSTIVGSIKKSYEQQYSTSFWTSNIEITHWCRKLMSLATRYNLHVKQDHPEVEQNLYYKCIMRIFSEIEINQDMLKDLIDKQPDDKDLKIFYLNSMPNNKTYIPSLKEEELKRIQNYSESIINQTNADRGILWKWFLASINMKSYDEAHIIGFLETLPTINSSIIANYLLGVCYFCRHLRTGDNGDADKSLYYQRICRDLSKKSIIADRRRSCPFYLDMSCTPPLVDNKEKSTKMCCTLTEDVIKEQSAYMTLDQNPKFKVVFVPHYNDFKPGQGFGLYVKATIGFSYNGLYGFDLES